MRQPVELPSIELLSKVQEGTFIQRFGKNIGGLLFRIDRKDLNRLVFDMASEMMMFQGDVFRSRGKFVRLGDSNCTAIVLKYFAVNFWFRHWNVEDAANLDE